MTGWESGKVFNLIYIRAVRDRAIIRRSVIVSRFCLKHNGRYLRYMVQ